MDTPIPLLPLLPVSALAGLRDALHRRQPQLAATAELFLLAAMPLLLAMVLDVRTINGVSIWMKPVKFALSFVVYFATLAWYFGYLPQAAQRSGAGRFVIVTAIAIGSAELLWITLAAAAGVRSHFNTTHPGWMAAYAFAGIGAVMLMVAVLVQGVQIARDRSIPLQPAFRLSLVLGAVIAAVGTVVTAGYLSQHGSHWVGGMASDAAGLPLLGWSRTGGDLRVPHFWALHAHQLLPVAGMLIAALPLRRPRLVVALVAVAYAAVVVATFCQALAGRPFI